MATLLFLEEPHKYELNGEELPSVSELTRFISREVYGDAPQYMLDNAAERGTKVHDALENIDRYGSVDVDDSILEYVKAYIKFRKEHKAEWFEIEEAYYHPTDMYAGRIDRYGTVDGKLCIVDFKTSSAIQKRLYETQLNLYRRMVESKDKKVEKLYILHLHKDGEYKLVEMDITDELATACITLHNALKKKKRRKKAV